MDPIDQLLSWAHEKGIVLNGITPKVLPGRGIGIVSTRPIEANETVLTVPSTLIRTIGNTPKTTTTALPSAPVHAILAASLSQDLTSSPTKDFSIWADVFPSRHDLTTSMPICWPIELQALLPSAAKTLLSKQRAKFDSHWALVSGSFPEIQKHDYLYAWLLVETRTFYHTTPKTSKSLPREDHMALQPVADLFNHSPNGCSVSFNSSGFSIKTTVPTPKAGDEMFIRYGLHSNDFLLVEYGFTLPRGLNTFDEVCLDEYLCPRFSAAQKDALEVRGFWGKYMLDAQTACYRTQVALRVLVLPEDKWLDVLDGERDEDADQEMANRQLLKALKKYASDIQDIKPKVNDAAVGDLMRNSLRDRWQQIQDMVDAAIERISK